jgi:uncharacterized protein YbjT (DUF2867 family)
MILLTGATGNNGSEIAKQLIATGTPVRALVRDRQKASSLDPKIEIVEGDLSQPETLDRAMVGVDKAFLLTAVDPQQVQLSSNFIEAAKRAGVQQIVKFSMFGAAANSPFALAQWHSQTEQELKDSGISWTILQPNDLMQNMRRFAQAIQTQGTISLPVQDGKISMVDLRDVAAVAVKALTEPGHTGKTYVLTGSEALSYTDIAQELSAAIGHPIYYNSPSPEAFKQSLIQSGQPAAAADLMNIMYERESQNHSAEVTHAVQEVTGKPPIAFDQFAQEFAAMLASRSAA